MMRNGEWKEITESKFITTSITCDVCGKTYDEEDDCFETSEFISIQHDCGYGSVFGDGSMVYIDICQHCIEELIGDKLKIIRRGTFADRVYRLSKKGKVEDNINIMEPIRINPKVIELLKKTKKVGKVD